MSAIVTEQKSILSDRQTDYLPQDLITIHLDSNEVAMLNGKDSYLHFNVRIENGQQTIGTQPTMKAQLDPNGGGAYALIDRLEIWNGDETAQLENLEEISVWMGMHNFYNKTEGLTNKRQLLEGQSAADYNLRNVPQSQYVINTTAGLGNVQSQTVECCLPLYMSGIFGADNMFPVIGCQGGLVIKIYLAEKQKALKAITTDGFVIPKSGQDFARNNAGPYPALDPSGVILASMPYNTAAVVPAGEPIPSQSLPLCWELAVDLAAAPTTAIDVKTTASAAVGVPTLPVDMRSNVAAGSAATAGEVCLNVVGQHIYYVDDAGVVQDCGVVTGVAVVGTDVRFTVATFTPTVATAANHQPVFGVISTSDDASYRITDFELIASSVENSPGYIRSVLQGLQSKGGLEVDIKTQNLYRQNQYAGDVKSQLLIPTTERRARALLEAQINPVLAWNTSYAMPINDQLQGYQYIIANKNVPNRVVKTDKEAVLAANQWNALCDAERVKCLRASKIKPLREVHPSGHFCYGRELAKSGFFADLNINDVRLTMDWGCPSGTAGAVVQPQKDKLLFTYCRHFRALIMTNANTVVSY